MLGVGIGDCEERRSDRSEGVGRPGVGEEDGA